MRQKMNNSNRLHQAKLLLLAAYREIRINCIADAYREAPIKSLLAACRAATLQQKKIKKKKKTTRKKKNESNANTLMDNLCSGLVGIKLKLSQKSGAPPLKICKGKGAVEQQNSKSAQHMDPIVDQEDMKIHFEEEMLMDILSRLPVRSLLRFKCVSKFWKTLISDLYFKMKHLSHAKNDQNSQKFLITKCCRMDSLYSLYCCPLSSGQLGEDVQELDFPARSRPRFCAVHCACNGLVIIMVSANVKDRSIFLLWNPSTRESIVLPDPEVLRKGTFCIGLGYDSTSGDYKIVKIHNGLDGSGSEVLALKSGSWRKIDKHPRGICNVLIGMHSLAFVHEAFHWISSSRNHYADSGTNYFVVSFSISNEVFGEIPLPEQIVCLRGNIYFGVSVLEGMLCVGSTSFGHRREAFKLWVLKEYGSTEYWTAVVAIDDPWVGNVVPKYRFADGEVLFWCWHSQSLGNTFRTSSGPFALWPHSGLQNGIAFTESLISPKSLTY